MYISFQLIRVNERLNKRVRICELWKSRYSDLYSLTYNF